MHCQKCHIPLPAEAKYCHQCGAEQITPLAQEDRHASECKIVLKQVGAKWALFGKEFYQFEAVSPDGSVIAASAKITLTGFDYYGPNDKNRKHKAALDGLLQELAVVGWQIHAINPKLWYDISLCKPGL